MTRSDRESIICALAILATFAIAMLVGFPLRFDGAMFWDLL